MENRTSFDRHLSFRKKVQEGISARKYVEKTLCQQNNSQPGFHFQTEKTCIFEHWIVIEKWTITVPHGRPGMRHARLVEGFDLYIMVWKDEYNGMQLELMSLLYHATEETN